MNFRHFNLCQHVLRIPEIPDPKLDRLTARAGLDHLAAMALEQEDLPSELRGHHPARSGPVDNAQIARQSFQPATAADMQRLGRQGGWIKEFAATADMDLSDGLNLAIATSAHLFDQPESVAEWIRERFIGQFQRSVGEPIGGDGAHLISARFQPDPAGFYDQCAALQAVQAVPPASFPPA